MIFNKLSNYSRLPYHAINLKNNNLHYCETYTCKPTQNKSVSLYANKTYEITVASAKNDKVDRSVGILPSEKSMMVFIRLFNFQQRVGPNLSFTQDEAGASITGSQVVHSSTRC